MNGKPSTNGAEQAKDIGAAKTDVGKDPAAGSKTAVVPPAAAPLISLESLSNPAALEAAIGKAAEKIEMEKKKVGGVKKKKSPKKKKTTPVDEGNKAEVDASSNEAKETTPASKEIPKVELVEPVAVKQTSPVEKRPKSMNIDDLKPGQDNIPGVKQRPKSSHLSVEDAEVADLDLKREWSPTPAPRTRRTSSFRNGKRPSPARNGGDASGDNKPPIPSGPSPPPPDEPPSVTVEASAAAASNGNGTAATPGKSESNFEKLALVL